jgi:alanyl-tRNA synthetase
LAREHMLLNSLTEIIKGARAEELPERVSDLVTKLRDIEKELASLRSAQALSQVAMLVSGARQIGEFPVIAIKLGDGIPGEDLRKIALDLRNRLSNSVIALISINDDKPILVVAVSEGARAAGMRAGALVKVGSAVLGGGGGGKDDFAQGGGIDPNKSSVALDAIVAAIAGE